MDSSRNQNCEPKSSKFKCEECKIVFRKKDNFDMHMFHHTGQRNYVCNFVETEGSLCSKSFTNLSHLKRHQKLHSNEPKYASISCKDSECNQLFANVQNMNRHFTKFHKGVFAYVCNREECGEKFHRKLQLKKHVVQKHSGEYPYRCEQCQKGFFNMYLFSRHLSTHKIKNRLCPDCDLSFDKWSALVEHKRKVHKNLPRFICDLCPKTFSRKPNIKDHMKLHTSLDQQVFHNCPYNNCPKFYNAKRNLMAHIRSKHEGRKKWVCDQCHQEKSTKQKLEQHLRGHLDPEKQKLLNKKLTYQTSVTCRLIGLKLPQDVHEKLLNNDASSINVESILPINETHDTETSATELSDF